MKKIFTFLCAALMSVGMWAEPITVTWNNNDITGSGKSFTKDGVTITAGMIDFNEKNFMHGGTFTTTLGNFTKIEVTAGDVYMLSGTGWSGGSGQKTWTGNASSVSFSGDIMGMGGIMGDTKFVFTIEPATVAVTGVTLNQNEAQMTVGGETLTLTATVNPNNATNKSVTWTSSDGNVATVNNGVVTAVAAGTATITVTTTDGSFTATCAVTVTAPEPAGKSIVVFEANGKKKEVEIESFPHTFWCNLGTENGELDLIIQELYALPLGGYCDAWNGPVATGNPAVTAGAGDEDDDFITISEAFEGTATVSGKYNRYTEMDEEEFYYTLTISTKNGAATAISNTAVETKAIKRIVNGQLLIEKNGKIYNVMGAEVK